MAQKVPRKYTSGLGKSTAARRKAEIRKRVSGKRTGSAKFKPLPGDTKKTRPSRYTLSAKKMRQEIREATSKMETGSQQDRFIRGVSKVTGIPKGIIDQVYKRGLAAWAVGHRPGATQSQWARARVYSFLQKGGAVTKGPDRELYQKAKKALEKKGKGMKLR
tara:strand:+ start:540 stop:1025 length:486 start_codon:yes stop_codon:yes gene_type:complete